MKKENLKPYLNNIFLKRILKNPRKYDTIMNTYYVVRLISRVCLYISSYIIIYIYVHSLLSINLISFVPIMSSLFHL